VLLVSVDARIGFSITTATPVGDSSANDRSISVGCRLTLLAPSLYPSPRLAVHTISLHPPPTQDRSALNTVCAYPLLPPTLREPAGNFSGSSTSQPSGAGPLQITQARSGTESTALFGQAQQTTYSRACWSVFCSTRITRLAQACRQQVRSRTTRHCTPQQHISTCVARARLDIRCYPSTFLLAAFDTRRTK
jgi:hypothetical protein